MTNYPKYNIDTLIKFLFYLFPILTVIRMMRGMGWLYYGTQIILLLFIILFAVKNFSKKIVLKDVTDKRYLILFTFPLWATLTALWSINPVSSALKGLNFVFVVTAILCGVLLLKLQDEKDLLKYILPANILVLVTSAFSLIFRFPADAWTIGHGLSFAGFFTHQNVLGMAALFTFPGIFSLSAERKAQSDKRRVVSAEGIGQRKGISHWWSLGHSVVENKNWLLFFLLLTFNFLVIVLSYSRSVILAVIVFAILWLVLNRKKRVLIFAGLLLIVVLTLAVFNKPFEDKLYKVAAKHPYSLFETRQMLWKPSFKAAKAGGFIGIGYGMNVPGIYVLKSDSLRSKDVNFYREKGNLGLAIIEETGIAGFIIFFAVIIYILMHLYRFKDNVMAQILLITIISLLVQSNFEGWSGGGNQMMQLFLIYSIYSLIISVSLNKTTNVLIP